MCFGGGVFYVQWKGFAPHFVAGWPCIKELPIPSILGLVGIFIITDSFETTVGCFSSTVQVLCKLLELLSGSLNGSPRRIISIWFSRPSLFIRVDPLLTATFGELFSLCCCMGMCAGCSLEMLPIFLIEVVALIFVKWALVSVVFQVV